MTRIHGLDLARALAVIGMMAAHLGPGYPVTGGYPSVLFAVLAGVSMGIISARTPADLPDTRFRLLLRGVILVGFGLLLSVVQTGIVEVLTAIGLSYVLLLPVVAWSARRLAVLLAVLVAAGPLLIAVDTYYVVNWGDPAVADLLTGTYPLLAWLAYLTVGLLIHRLVLTGAAVTRQVWLAGIGLLLLAAVQLIIEATDFRVGPGDILNPIGAYLQGGPHTGGLLDVIGSAGAAMMVTGLCLLLCRVGAVVWISYPLRALGAMSLTVYVTHVLVTGWYRDNLVSLHTVYDGQFQPVPGADFGWTMYTPLDTAISPEPNWLWMFGIQLVVLLIFASLWRRRLRRGPLEWGVHRVIESTVGGPPRPVN
ncbi:DUF418 domain-containing protein [Corynebacterium sp. YIM 101645]|uniref:DUF418 domain-containing protein n=1 Tax=Corynebacterium lemuris TaxID=1859292 RepID=A0ABT2FUK1_9CORY|nr:DUF418 domain-containing protein [Corynebacterium lemuris]MCS5478915.1 DUF418 domain-containing protein [Corynebacterium lemuris]